MRPLLALVGAVVFLDTLFFAALAPLIPGYVDELGLTKSQAGVLGASYAAGAFASAIPAGMLAARIGVRPTVMLGLSLLAASSIAFGLADNVLLLDAARFMQGVGGSCSWAAALAWLVGAAPPERRGELIGTALGLALAGALAGPAIGALAEGVGKPPVFTGVAITALGLAAIARVLDAPAGRGRAAGLGPLARSFRDPRIASGSWLLCLFGLVGGAVGVLVPLRFDDLGAGAGVIAAVFLVAAAGEAIVNPLAGRMSDRRGRLAPLWVSLPAAGLAVALLPAPNAVWLLALLMVVYAAAIGVLFTPGSALLGDGASAHGVELALAYALLNVVWSIGNLFGASGGGALADATSDAVAFGLLAGLIGTTWLVLRRPSPALLEPATSARRPSS